jgi:hypothetical protein
MGEFWTGFVVGWVAGVLVASLAPRFLIWQRRRYQAARDRRPPPDDKL